ncbi:MAG: PIN domain-containing protein [Bryobacteraceae bacterium]
MIKATISSKGQIAIPKAVRQRLNLKAGTEISIDVQGEALVVKRLVRSFPDWRTMQGMARGGESLTQALEAEHRAELARTMPNSKVVDAWALLAWVRDEQPAAGHVLNCLQQAEEATIQLSMSWIDAGEVYYMLTRKHGSKTAEDFLTRLPSLPIRLVLPEEEDIIAAVRLKSAHRLPYADAFAAALAAKENAAVIAGDPEMRNLANVIMVDWIGAPSAGPSQ